MAPTTKDSVDAQLQYVMLVLSTCEISKLNYHTVAELSGICSANEAQKKFRAAVISSGFVLEKGKISIPDGAPNPVQTTPKKAVKARKAKAQVDEGPALKKRKRDADEGEEDDNGDGAENTGEAKA